MFKPAMPPSDGSAVTPARLNFLQRLESLAIRPAARNYYVRWAEAFPVGELDQFVHAKHQKRLPLVLTKDETERVLKHLEGLHLLMARLLYGTGIRLNEPSHPCQHHPDLHPRPQQTRPQRPQPT